ncbi:MAG TPA: hypothetical protein VIC28_05380 [Thermoanaerobaculia bacterium]|jgi:hypothetical protein
MVFLSSRFTLVGFCLLALCIFHACRQRDYREGDRHAKAEVIWREHESALRRAVEGALLNDEFADACEFFRKVAGIEIRGDGSHIGWIPNENTRADLEKVHDWYEENGARLYWDDRSQSVKVRPPR